MASSLLQSPRLSHKMGSLELTPVGIVKMEENFGLEATGKRIRNDGTYFHYNLYFPTFNTFYNSL